MSPEPRSRIDAAQALNRNRKLSITEAQWQRTVIEAAAALGWRCYHTHDSRRSQEGFPDLVLVRDRVLFVELKIDKAHSKMSVPQLEWQVAIQDALDRWWMGAGVDAEAPNPFEHLVWRPSDWPEVYRVLVGKAD